MPENGQEILFPPLPTRIRVQFQKPYWRFFSIFRNYLRPTLEERLLEALAKIGIHKSTLLDSGKSAIFLALKNCGVKQGDEVVLPSFVCKAVIQATVACGATPVYADIGDDYNMDVHTVKKAISSRTKVVIAVHQYGKLCQIEEIRDLVRKQGIMLIEDAAVPIGIKNNRSYVGFYGDYSVFSFNLGKTIVAFGGGVLSGKKSMSADFPTNRVAFLRFAYFLANFTFKKLLAPPFALLRKLRIIRRDEDVPRMYAQKNRAPVVILPRKMSRLQMAATLSQLQHLDIILGRQQSVAETYIKELQGIASVGLPSTGRTSWTYFPIRVPNRYALSVFLAKHGIETQWTFYPLHLQTAYALYHGTLPRTERDWKTILSLPIGPHVRPAQAKYVASLIRTYYAQEPAGYREHTKSYFAKHAIAYPESVRDWRLKLLNTYNRGGSVLDLGCGTGNYLLQLKNPKRTGIDISAESIVVLRKRASKQRERLRAAVGDITRMPFKQDEFSFVYSFSTLYYIKEVDAAIAEISRVLRSDGIAVLEFGNRNSVNAIWDKMLFRVPQFHFSEKHIRDCMKQADLRVKRVLYRQLFPDFFGLFDRKYLTSRIVQRLAFRMIFVVEKK